jgi:hypothetical protein
MKCQDPFRIIGEVKSSNNDFPMMKLPFLESALQPYGSRTGINVIGQILL